MIKSMELPQNSIGFLCDFCAQQFRKESSLLVHLCEQKRRHREQDDIGARFGFSAYLRFYEITQGSSRLKTWENFRTSAYYRAFVKFGRHCQALKAINISALTDWLIRNNVKLDHWCQDQIYTRYLIQHVRTENVIDALSRALECSIVWEDQHHNPSHDYYRYGNDNAICHDITRGHVTGWTVYNCASGKEFLDRINSEQIAIIWDFIDTDIWQRKFQDYPADTEYVTEILKQAGW